MPLVVLPGLQELLQRHQQRNEAVIPGCSLLIEMLPVVLSLVPVEMRVDSAKKQSLHLQALLQQLKKVVVLEH